MLKTAKEATVMSKRIKHSFERYEKKYFLTLRQYILLKDKIQSNIRADEYPTYTLCNIYYDTDDYRLIRASLEKPVYKEKLRLRSYGVPQKGSDVFAEIKKKFDGVVYKRRIVIPADGDMTLPDNNQIAEEIRYFRQLYDVKPKVFIAYDREAYSGADNPDLRITFDTNLRYRLNDLDLCSGDYGDPIIDWDKILMEIKIPGVCPLWLSRTLSELKIYPESFSKYGECYKRHILGENKSFFTKEARLSA